MRLIGPLQNLPVSLDAGAAAQSYIGTLAGTVADGAISFSALVLGKILGGGKPAKPGVSCVDLRLSSAGKRLRRSGSKPHQRPAPSLLNSQEPPEAPIPLKPSP